jgi:CheY-like chemotaxis protein
MTGYILHLDDEKPILQLIERALGHRGHQVRSAQTLAEVAKVTAGSRPALIICDLHLAEGDGVGAIQELRARFPRVPVLLLTGAVNDGTIRSRYRDLADGFVPKPAPLARIITEVEHLLAG